jgi:hypothetical protein
MSPPVSGVILAGGWGATRRSWLEKVKICHLALFVIQFFKPIQAIAFCFAGSELFTGNDGWL